MHQPPREHIILVDERRPNMVIGAYEIIPTEAHLSTATEMLRIEIREDLFENQLRTRGGRRW
jgi:hypothetical protein